VYNLNMKKKRFVAFNEVTFTKLVAIAFILPWLTILTMQSIYLWSRCTIGGDMSAVLEATGYVVAIVASGYFARSGYDMYTGYKYGSYGSYGNQIRSYDGSFPL
jgi:hypothetical protein